MVSKISRLKRNIAIQHPKSSREECLSTLNSLSLALNQRIRQKNRLQALLMVRVVLKRRNKDKDKEQWQMTYASGKSSRKTIKSTWMRSTLSNLRIKPTRKFLTGLRVPLMTTSWIKGYRHGYKTTSREKQSNSHKKISSTAIRRRHWHRMSFSQSQCAGEVWLVFPLC